MSEVGLFYAILISEFKFGQSQETRKILNLTINNKPASVRKFYYFRYQVNNKKINK